MKISMEHKMEKKKIIDERKTEKYWKRPSLVRMDRGIDKSGHRGILFWTVVLNSYWVFDVLRELEPLEWNYLRFQKSAGFKFAFLKSDCCNEFWLTIEIYHKISLNSSFNNNLSIGDVFCWSSKKFDSYWRPVETSVTF